MCAASKAAAPTVVSSRLLCRSLRGSAPLEVPLLSFLRPATHFVFWNEVIFFFAPDHHLGIPHQEVVRPARESWDTDESARAEGAQLPSSDKSDFVLTSPSPSPYPPSSFSSRTRQCWMAGH